MPVRMFRVEIDVPTGMSVKYVRQDLLDCAKSITEDFQVGPNGNKIKKPVVRPLKKAHGAAIFDKGPYYK